MIKAMVDLERERERGQGVGGGNVFEPRLVFNGDDVDAQSADATPPWQALCNWKSLHFFSNFESANLRRAVQIGEWEYDLMLATDTKTRRHVQWFYFRVSGTERGSKYKFNLVNMRKKDSLFNYGLRPLMLSTKAHLSSGTGWHRAGTANSLSKVLY